MSAGVSTITDVYNGTWRLSIDKSCICICKILAKYNR